MSDARLRMTSKDVIEDNLNRELSSVNSKLGGLNRELAAKMIQLAAQTGDTSSLIEAVQALRKAKTYYQVETAPRDSLDVQHALADTLLCLGRQTNDKMALNNALEAYRSAITLASLIGDEDLRADLKSNYTLTQGLLGEAERTPSLFNVA